VRKQIEDNYLSVFLIFSLSVALVIRILALEPRVLWWDELFTWWLIQLDFRDSLTVIFYDVHPPVYYFLLRAWSFFLGTSELSLRLMSLVLSLLSIYYVFVLSKIFSDRAAIFSTVLVVFSSYHAFYSLEVRFYALMSLLSVMSVYYLVKFLDEGGTYNRITYILSTLVLVYTHIYGFFILAAQAVFYLWKAYNKDYRGFKEYTAVVLGTLPLIGALIHQRYYLFVTGEEDFWIDRPTFNELHELFETLSGSYEILSIYIILLGIGLYCLRNQSKIEKDLSVLLWLYLIFSILVPWIISYTIFPMFMDRFVISGVIMFYILAGYGISRIPDNVIQVVVVSSLIIVAGSHLNHDTINYEKEEPWDEVVGHVESEIGEDDIIVYHGSWSRFAFHKYGQKEDYNKKSIPENYVHDPDDNYKWVSNNRTRVDEEDIKNLEDSLDDVENTWLILSHEKGITGDLIDEIYEGYEEKKFHDYRGIRLYEFHD